MSSPPINDRTPERFIPLGLGVGVLGLAISLWVFMGACAGGTDSSGYLNSARLLARGEASTPVRSIEGLGAGQLTGYIDEVYTPMGFRPMLGGGKISAIYPIGFPLLMAGAARAVGWEKAPGLTIGLHALLGVLLVYALGRQSGLPPGWSALGALVLGVSPLYLFMSLQAMSDVPALVWATASLLAAWRSRTKAGWAVLAGAGLGIAVMVRPTNLLMVLPVAVALGKSGRRVTLFVLGALPAAGLLLAYNHAAYGSALAQGYFNPPDVFAWHRVDSTFIYYARWLPVLLTPVVCGVFALPWAASLDKTWKWILGLWIAAILGLYSAYVFTHMSWWFLRFLLPAFPPLIVAALHGLRSFSGRKPGIVSPAVAWAAVALVIFLHGAGWSRALRARAIGGQERAYAETAARLQADLPANAIILAMQDSGALFYSTPFTLVRWDWLEPRQFAEVARVAAKQGRPIYAALQNFEEVEARAFSKHIPGQWEKVERVQATTVWRLVAGP